ncbi:MAG: RHS repeat-associated core domain-containing protein [Pyrinomonadaceae bacterium]
MEVTTRKDYAAFGEEIFTANRVSGLSYSSSQEETRKGYTGYEKDDESGLDFAQARYYNSVHGRYTSVDPLTASATIRNPQTFNRYSYVLNSPYKFTDPLGLLPSGIGRAGYSYCGASYSSCEGDDYDSPVQTGTTAPAVHESQHTNEAAEPPSSHESSEAQPMATANEAEPSTFPIRIIILANDASFITNEVIGLDQNNNPIYFSGVGSIVRIYVFK